MEAVKGLRDAATNISWKGDGKSPVAFVSGNVSFYNESAAGKQVDPSPIIACVGYMDDYEKAITMKIKNKGSNIFSVGKREDELGGSVYYDLLDKMGKNVPKVNFENEKKMIYAIVDCIDNELLLSCHDISDGGILTTLAEMILGGEADGKIGIELNLDSAKLLPSKALFSETSGFVFEVDDNNVENVKEIFEKYDLELIGLGKTTDEEKLIIEKDNAKIIDLTIEDMKEAWCNGVVEALR